MKDSYREAPGASPPLAGAVISVSYDDAVRSILRSRRWVWVPIAARLLMAAALAMAGYPAWRLAVVAALGAAVTAMAMAVRRAGQLARSSATALIWVAIAQTFLAACVTGGLHGPLAFTILVTASTVFSMHGWSRDKAVEIALLSLAIVGLALLPARWAGPVPAGPWFAALALLACAETLLMHVQLVAVLRDTASAAVGEAIRAREELAEEALARARELERIGSQLSHELKNPLAAIKALVQLSARSATDAGTQERLGVVEGEIERMTTTLQRHLSFTRPHEQLRPVRSQLGPLADAVLDVLRGRATHAGVTLRRKGNAQATVDPLRLKEALINLVANAIEASPRLSQVEVALSEDEAGVRVAVRDAGAGMPPEVLARVGTPFFTTREQGTGLGVVLARAAFEQHGGSLQLTSEPGRGTEALGTLPRTTALQHGGVAAPSEAVALDGASASRG